MPVADQIDFVPDTETGVIDFTPDSEPIDFTPDAGQLKRPPPTTLGESIAALPAGDQTSLVESAVPGIASDMASGEGPGAFDTLMEPMANLPSWLVRGAIDTGLDVAKAVLPVAASVARPIADRLVSPKAREDILQGTAEFGAEAASGMTSPGMLGLLGVGYVAPPMAAAAIAAMGARGIGPALVDVLETSKAGDLKGLTKASENLLMAATMTGGGAHGLADGLKPTPRTKELMPITSRAVEELIAGGPVPRVLPRPAKLPAPLNEVELIDFTPESKPPISIKANVQMLDVLEPQPGDVGTVEALRALAEESDNSILLRVKNAGERDQAFDARAAAIDQIRRQEPAPTPPEKSPTPPEPAAPTEPVAPTAPPAIATAPQAPQKPEGDLADPRIPVEYVPLGQLSLSADVPQFKAGANEKGVVRPLGGKFDPTGVGPIQVWRRLNGNLEVITGRHRFDLAQRSGETEILSQVHNEADGFTAADAAKLDAVLNIRDGQGTIGDYARFFKYSDFTQETAKSEGLLADSKGKAGFAIGTGASEDLFALHQAEKLGDAQAAAIATAAPNNPGLQAVGIRIALDGRSAEAVGDVMRLAAQKTDLKKSAADQGVLFDFDDSAIREMEAQSALASKERSGIRSQINAVKGAARKPEMAKAMGVDVSDPAGILKKVQELEARLFLLKDHPELAGQLPETPAPPAPAVPKLRAGGTGEAELFHGADAPFNLSGETTSDGARLEAEQTKAAADAAEAKRITDEQQSGFTGMGGAVPSEFGGTGGSPTAAKFRQIDKERMDRGLEALIKPESNTDAMSLQKAMGELDMKGPIIQDELIAKLKVDPTLAIKDWEVHLLVLRKIDLSNELHRSMREGLQAYKDGRMDDVAAITPRTQIWSEKLTEVEEALRYTGTAASGAMRARKLMINEDFSVEKMKMDRLADRKFRKLSPEAEAAENVELAQKSEALLASNKAFEARVAELEKQVADAEVKQALDEAKAAAAAQPTYSKPVLEAAERIVQGWEKRADAARARLKEKLWLTGTTPDVTIIIDLAEIGVAHIGRGLVEFAKWSDVMVSEFGDKMKPLLKDVWEASQKLSNLETDKLKEPIKDQVKRKIRNVDVAEKITDAKEKIERQVEKGESESVTPNVRALVNAFVEQNPKIKPQNLVDQVHDVLKEFLPEITRDETADAMTGRGKFFRGAQDELSKTVRDLLTQIRLVSHQQDVLAGKPLPRTGYQPDPYSDAARQEQAKLNELKRKYGVVVTDPTSQLASTLAARKTYYRHRISDIEQEISTREKIVKTKSPSPTDAELEALRAEHKRIKAEHDEIFGRPEKTPEQRAAAALKAVERSITELERQIKTGDIGPKSRASKTPNTPELEAARARRDALVAERDELRDLDQALNEAKAEKAKATQIAALEKEIAAVKETITKGDLAAKQTSPRQNRPAQPEIEQAKQRLEELRTQLIEARATARKADPVRLAAAEQRSIAAQKKTLEKQIAEREAILTSGNLKPGQRMNRPLSPAEEARKQRIEAELAPLKTKLDQTNAILEQARKDARPTKTPEERALAALKTRLTKSNADIADRLARGDFSPRPKRPPIDISKDTAAMTLKAENERLKKEYQQGRIRDQMKHWGKGRMFWEGTKETANLYRNYKTSFDLSAVLRQGGFFTFGHPIKAARALKTSIEALVSEKAALTEEQRILHRPNATLYARDKLYLPEINEARLSAQEEMTMSRLARKIPGLKASNRAFITFLNRMRADMYDSLVENLPLKDRGRPTAEEGKAVADFVNVATGRGKLGRFEAAGELASTILFSPRLMVSRFQLLAGHPFYGGTARTRLAFAKEYARALIGVGTVYALGSLAGADIEEDPRSSDFGKLKFGNSRLDPLAGLQQVTVLVSRVGSSLINAVFPGTFKGETKSLRTGQLSSLRDPKFGQPDTAEVIGRFLRTKLAPAPGLFVDIATGSNVVGEPVAGASVAKDVFIPLGYQDIFDVMRDQGIPAGTALELLNVLGMSLQNFDASKKQPKN